MVNFGEFFKFLCEFYINFSKFFKSLCLVNFCWISPKFWRPYWKISLMLPPNQNPGYAPVRGTPCHVALVCARVLSLSFLRVALSLSSHVSSLSRALQRALFAIVPVSLGRTALTSWPLSFLSASPLASTPHPASTSLGQFLCLLNNCLSSTNFLDFCSIFHYL